MPIGKDCLPQKITVFHRLGETDGVARYHKTVLSDVRIEERLAINQTLSGERSIETFKAFIDVEKQNGPKFVDAKAFSEFSEEERDGFWTVSEGDYILPAALTSDDAEKSVTLLKSKMRVFTVNAFSALYDSRGIHHLEVSGRGKLLE